MPRKNLSDIIEARRKALKEKSLKSSVPLPVSLQAYNLQKESARVNVPEEISVDSISVKQDSVNPRDLFIHWYYLPRKIDRLTLCERFHLEMLHRFGVPNKVGTIHIRCACTGKLTDAMKQAVTSLSGYGASIDFKLVPQKRSWEHDTFRECVEFAVSTGKFTYYTHFKGVTHIEDPNVICKYRNGSKTDKSRVISSINIMYWCYVMYRYMFEDAPNDSIAVGPLYYKGRPTLHYSDGESVPRWSLPLDGHYTGSFQAFNGKELKDRFLRKGVDRDLRDKTLWVGDPYTVEQFLNMCFNPKEISSLSVYPKSPYTIYDDGSFPQYRKDFDSFYINMPNNICIANGTYKWIGGTDTFNWAMAKAFKELGYNVYYYSPNMDGRGVTEKYLNEIDVHPYLEGLPLLACFANQQSGSHFVGKCPVVQTCHSRYTGLELPIKGAKAYVSISEEIRDYLKGLKWSTTLLRNGCDLDRYYPATALQATPRVLSICQGNDEMLRRACSVLKWQFTSVPKETGKRIWHIEDLINQADIVVGIGRSLYDAMACGRVCISWDNRKLNPNCGCGYVTKENWHEFAKTNFTGRGFPRIETVRQLLGELRKYNPKDGADMREMAEEELDARKNAVRYLELAGISV